MNYKYGFFTTLLVSGVLALGSRSAPPQEKPRTPADGHDIHVLAPHMMDGKVMGPYHHYCKAVSSDVLECLIYESTEPNALLKQVEYFVAKSVSRPNVARWDHLSPMVAGRRESPERDRQARAVGRPQRIDRQGVQRQVATIHPLEIAGPDIVAGPAIFSARTTFQPCAFILLASTPPLPLPYLSNSIEFSGDLYR